MVFAVRVGGYDHGLIDFEIPKKYNYRQTIADTLGIGGLMRGLRTVPVVEEFARDMEEVCPDALLLRYGVCREIQIPVPEGCRRSRSLFPDG